MKRSDLQISRRKRRKRLRKLRRLRKNNLLQNRYWMKLPGKRL